MNNLEIHKGSTNLVVSEASGGTKGGGSNCDDLPIQRDDVPNAGTGNSSTSSNVEIAQTLPDEK